MRKLIEELVPIDRTEVTCDDCGRIITHPKVCSKCNKDLCEKCVVYDQSDPGDYPSKYCRDCDKLGIKYRKAIKEIENESDARIETLSRLWLEDCLASRKKADNNSVETECKRIRSEECQSKE